MTRAQLFYLVIVPRQVLPWRRQGYSASHILAGREKLYWLGLDRVGVRTSRIVLFWHKCLDLMDKFNKDEVTLETSIMMDIKR